MPKPARMHMRTHTIIPQKGIKSILDP